MVCAEHDQKLLRRIVGGNSSMDLKVKAVAGSSEWHLNDLIAGRLDPTMSADITDTLASKNITVISCKLLKTSISANADDLHDAASLCLI